MKKKKLFIALALVLVYRSLVRIWPRLKREKIESIRFTQAMNPQTGLENETFFQEIITTFGFRVIDANVVKSWPLGYEVPEENLPECIKIIDKAMKDKSIDIWLGRMLIVTDKGKYIVHVETDISEVAGPKVYGEEWTSYELGKFLAKCCFPNLKYKYILPPREQVVAILLYPPKFSPPLAFFGDKKLAEKLLFETRFLDDPNGIKGIGSLYKLTRLRTFGVETRIEGKEIITGNKLKAKHTFEGRSWLEKIMDAYEIALKEAEEKEDYYPGRPDHFDARIVFMTQDGDCWKEIGIDENAVFDDYIKSEQLKAYFDELGLTKELLVGEPVLTPKNCTIED